MKKLLLFIITVTGVLNFLSCSEVECPLDSVVVMTCGVYDADTKERHPLQHTLTIKPSGKDTVLLNSAQDIDHFVLPLKMGETCDTMVFYLTDQWGSSSIDTLFVEHQNMPHFESVECPGAIFHKLTRVTFHAADDAQLPIKIDSVAVVRDLVDYYDVENVQIYLRTDD